MPIAQIPLAPPVCIRPDHAPLDALQWLVEHNLNHLPVCADGKLLGLLSINDLLLQLIPPSAKIEGGLADLSFAGDAPDLLASMLEQLKSLTAGAIMHQPAAVLRDDCPLLEAALLLSRHDAPLPVLDQHGSFRGMLSRRVLLAYILNNPSTP